VCFVLGDAAESITVRARLYKLRTVPVPPRGCYFRSNGLTAAIDEETPKSLRRVTCVLAAPPHPVLDLLMNNSAPLSGGPQYGDEDGP
jgi:hypothetical protein